jgi:V/A-type H+/Na+-transporting ATPase subunit E
MADQIKELIEKINQEGVAAAEEKARQIESQAKAQAEMAVQKANSQAKKIVEEAQEKVKRMQENSEASLKQAGRDLMLTLKIRINQTLENLISAEISACLNPEEMGKIIEGLIKEYCAKENKGTIVYLSAEDQSKLEGLFLTRLKDELKKGIELRSQEDIRSGFIISFDAGKSSFDFSNKALVDYIGLSLKAKVAELLQDTK